MAADEDYDSTEEYEGSEDYDTSELEPVSVTTEAEAIEQPALDGVTPSEDWASDEPEDYSAPV